MIASLGRYRSAVSALRPLRLLPKRTFILRTEEDLTALGQVVQASTGTWTSRRYTLRGDGMGFSFHKTTIKDGEPF